jgi:hypothetical protein
LQNANCQLAICILQFAFLQFAIISFPNPTHRPGNPSKGVGPAYPSLPAPEQVQGFAPASKFSGQNHFDTMIMGSEFPGRRVPARGQAD